jgi:hypothetical protein
MFWFTFRSDAFRKKSPKRQARSRWLAAKFRPRLESCEERLLPSVFTVVDLGDAGNGSGLQGDLRYAINTANDNADLSNRIVFQTGLTGTITLTQGKLVVSKPLEINGPGADLLTISGNHQSGVFDIEAPAGRTVIFSDLTIADGTSAGQDQFGSTAGGGLFNDAATLVLERTTFTRNMVPLDFASTGGGGAIFNFHGNVTLNDSIISGNQTGDERGNAPGAAIRNLGTMAVHHSTVSGNRNGVNVSVIDSDGTMTLEQCVIADNWGDISNGGTLTMTACTVTGNTGFTGGGLQNVGRVTITDSSFLNNSSQLSGGAIAQFLGEMTVSGSTIAGNRADGNGGGIVVTDGHLDLTNSTISGNAGRQGGGISYGRSGGVPPVLEVTSSTITLNRAAGTFNAGGGGIKIDSGSTRTLIRNTIIAGNQTALDGPDVKGPVLSLGYNLVGQTDGSTGWNNQDLRGTSDHPIDPVLGPLQDNGGPTFTHALLVGSPALQSGDPEELMSPDQRGSVRYGFLGSKTDIGAFEAGLTTQFRLVAPASVTAGQPFDLTVVALDQWGNVASTYTGTVHFSSTDLFAQLPDDSAFTGDDAGAHTFTVALLTPGQQEIEVVDTGSPFGSGSVTVDVVDAAAPKKDLGWLADGQGACPDASAGLANLGIPAAPSVVAVAQSYSTEIATHVPDDVIMLAAVGGDPWQLTELFPSVLAGETLRPGLDLPLPVGSKNDQAD